VNGKHLALGALLLLIGWQAIRHWERRAFAQPDGILVPDDPVQGEKPEDAPQIVVGRWTLTPRATYDISARVLGREEYRFDDLAEFAPEDLALGWGLMSDNTILRQLDMEQASRFFTVRPRHEVSFSRAQVNEHSANTHVIPADDTIARALKRLRVGQIVHLQGLLVDAVRSDGRHTRTSLTRVDSGEGACEIMYVQMVDTN